tara:strand:- start:5451 stop:5657 length:207 start_codon:yes stop_codon:yes gene_type:complete
MDRKRGIKTNHTWKEVAERLSEIEGHKVSHQAACDSGHRLLKRLRYKFLADPVIRDWLLDQGIETEDL